MSDLPLTTSTELDAVNLMLLSIGQAPVNTLDVSGLRDASLAKLWLAHANRTVQSNGWSWNREYDYELTPDVNGFLMVADNVLSLEASDPFCSWTVRRDLNDSLLKVYDRKCKTFVFPASGVPYKCNITWLLDFESLPQTARTYIGLRAGQFFQSAAVGSPTLFQFDDAKIQEALLPLTRVEQRAKGSNLLRYSLRSRRNFNHFY